MKKRNIPSIIFAVATIILVVVLFVITIYNVGFPRYPQIENARTFLLCILLLILLPVLLIWGAAAGIRKGLTWYSVMIFVCSIFYIPLWFLGCLGSFTIYSGTTAVTDYGQFDSYVDTYMQNNDGHKLLDVNLDSGTITNYQYRYIPMDRSFIVFADISFSDMDAYQKEQQRLNTFTLENKGDYIEIYSAYTHVGTVQFNPTMQAISYFITNDGAQSWVTYQTNSN